MARQWKDTRSDNRGGGLASSVADHIRWARFHLGHGRAENGARVLPAEVLHRMKQQTGELHMGTLGDAIGICRFTSTTPPSGGHSLDHPPMTRRGHGRLLAGTRTRS